MKPQVAQLWTKALRSDEYKQTTGCLENDYGNCCLGVLCRLAQKDGVKLDVRPGDDGLKFNGEGWVVPEKVLDWSGLKTNTGRFASSDGIEVSLSGYNDNGSSFEELADIIDKNVEVL